MHNGYIKIYRKIVETAFFKNPVCVQLAILCLVKANHKQQKIILNQKEVILERGQFVSGLFSLSHEMHTSMQKVRTALKILSNCGFLTRKSTNKFSIITIEKYGQYQDGECLSNNQNNKPVTNKQQTNNKQITTDNNDKNDKNDKNVKNVTTSSSQKFAFSGDILKIPEASHLKFIKAFPEIDLNREYEKMDAWLVSNPQKKKKNFSSFANNWFGRIDGKYSKEENIESEPYIP